MNWPFMILFVVFVLSAIGAVLTIRENERVISSLRRDNERLVKEKLLGGSWYPSLSLGRSSLGSSSLGSIFTTSAAASGSTAPPVTTARAPHTPMAMRTCDHCGNPHLTIQEAIRDHRARHAAAKNLAMEAAPANRAKYERMAAQEASLVKFFEMALPV